MDCGRSLHPGGGRKALRRARRLQYRSFMQVLGSHVGDEWPDRSRLR